MTNVAGLLKYFCCEPKQKLPVWADLKGSLGEKVPSSSIELTNNVIHDILDKKTIPCEACCRIWSNSNSTILCKAFPYNSPNLPFSLSHIARPFVTGC